MSEVKIAFAALAWDEPTEGVRAKTVTRDGKKLRLVEFAAGYREHDWCRKRHVGYVLEGEMELTFADRVERFKAGDGLFILGGEAEQHSVRAVGSVAKLVLVEDA